MKYMHMAFGAGDFVLDFRVRSTALAKKWVKKVRAAQRLGYPIDDPTRFYSFDSADTEIQQAALHLQQQICIINSYKPIITRPVTDVTNQDTLNYLHHVFEIYHGLLDQQQHEFWQQAPDNVKLALSRLNTAVHRCENVYRDKTPLAVVTYYGLPKKHTMTQEDYATVEPDWRFGTVQLCYVEIGKTLFDLSQDRDNYIARNAFRPQKHFSADFAIQFNNSDSQDTQNKIKDMTAYYDQNKSWFEDLGYYIDDPCMAYGIYPVADLDCYLSESTILQHLKQRQRVYRVWFT